MIIMIIAMNSLMHICCLIICRVDGVCILSVLFTCVVALHLVPTRGGRVPELVVLWSRWTTSGWVASMIDLGSVRGTGAMATCENGNICRSADVPNCVESACAGDPLLGSPEAKCVESLHESHMGCTLCRVLALWCVVGMFDVNEFVIALILLTKLYAYPLLSPCFAGKRSAKPTQSGVVDDSREG